eukprot:gene15836-21457_t
MPRFVPVIDTETPLSEQQNDPEKKKEYAKHRQFDALSAPVDRGWKQGALGWGVLGSYGSNDKDQIAQVIKRDGNSKMVKNEKGLWVKAKESDEQHLTSKLKGSGRGGGIPVLPSTNAQYRPKSPSYSHQSETNHDYMKSTHQHGDLDDLNESKHRWKDKEFHRPSGHHNHEKRSRSRSPSYNNSKQKPQTKYEKQSCRRDSRSRSRSPNREKYVVRNRSKSPQRRRNQGRSVSREKKFSRSRSRDRYESKNKTKYYKDHSVNRSSLEESKLKHEKKTDLIDEIEDGAVDGTIEPFRITAVQIINRFHEVFQSNPLFISNRLNDIESLFEENSFIASLKNGSNYISGRTAVRDSFLKTTSSEVTISKRIFVDNNGPITFCFDLHRSGTSPGLGDRTKDTVLLYKCCDSHIQGIWGTADQEKLASNTELSKSELLSSKLWKYALQYIHSVMPDLNDEIIHYHNYDHMEVWG